MLLKFRIIYLKVFIITEEYLDDIKNIKPEIKDIIKNWLNN